MSSDRYKFPCCDKWHDEPDLIKDNDGKLICPDCLIDRAAGGVPKKVELCCDCGVAEVDPPPLCGACWAKDFHERHKDVIKQPDNSHYTKGGIEPWEYIRANNLNFFEGSVVKYITRWRHKNGLEDLLKAEVYIKELIRQEREHEKRS
jgi:hypothetical protein